MTDPTGASDADPQAALREPVRRDRSLRRPPARSRPQGSANDVPAGSRRSRASARVAGRVLGGSPGARSSRQLPTSWARWAPSADQLHLLSELLDAGLPLVEALGTLGDMAHDLAARSAFAHLESQVRAGGTLAAGLAALAAPAHVRMLVDGGERTGRVAEALRSAGVLSARLEELRTEVRRAFVYPGVVLAIGTVILTVIANMVVPALERTFVDLGGELPAATRIVISASRPLSSPVSAAVVAAALAAGVVLRGAVGRVDVGAAWRRILGEHAVGVLGRVGALVVVLHDHVPLRGRLRRDLRLAVVAHVMAALARGGVPLDRAFDHVARSTPHAPTRRVLRAAAEATSQGRSAFEHGALAQVLDPVEREMLQVGERNGLVAEQWTRIASRRDRALEGRMQRLGVVVEPLLVALVGGVVGGAVLALYLPTFRVLELL